MSTTLAEDYLKDRHGSLERFEARTLVQRKTESPIWPLYEGLSLHDRLRVSKLSGLDVWSLDSDLPIIEWLLATEDQNDLPFYVFHEDAGLHCPGETRTSRIGNTDIINVTCTHCQMDYNIDQDLLV